MNREIADALDTGNGLVLFPEGTSTDGSQVHRFKPSLLEMAVRSGRPVDYCSLSYRTPPGERPASLSVCWWGDMNLLSHVYGMLALPGYEATIEFGGEPVSATDRKELAQELRQAVDEIFVPVSQASTAFGRKRT